MEEMKDIVKGGIKAALSTTPIGAFFVTLTSELQAGIFQRRFDEWKNDVEAQLEDLEDAVKDTLKNNEIFATVLLLSGQIALRTNALKRHYLANAVKKAATTKLPEDRVVILLNCIDKYTLAHFELLSFLQSPWNYRNKDDYYMSTTTLTIFEDSHPKRDKGIDQIAIRDLYADGMITSDTLSTMSTVEGAFSKRTSDLGDAFIDFFGLL